MSYIRMIDYEGSEGRLRDLYRRIGAPAAQIDNVLGVHSLRPHTLEGHLAIYKAVLHHRGNALPDAYLEAIGVWVSLLNECDYCVRHHLAGLASLVGGDAEAGEMIAAMRADRFEDAFSAREAAGLAYAGKLARAPASVGPDDIAALRAAGFSDGEILEINQVSAYFAYANRTVLGLGVSAEGEVLGLAPRNQADEGDFTHC